MNEVFLEIAFRPSEAKRRKVALHQRHHGLAFRITEAAVVLDHLRAIRRQHEAEVEEATVRKKICSQAIDGRLDDFLLDLFQKLLINEASARHRAHAAGVRAFVAVSSALVIAGRREDHEAVIDDGREDRNLRTDQAFLDQHPSLAEALFSEDFMEETLGRFVVRAHRHAFSGCESVELQDCRVNAANRCSGLLQVATDARLRRRDLVAEEEFL